MVICPDCGKDVKDAKFCANCGASLKSAAETIVEEAVPVEETVEQTAEETGNEIIEVEINEETTEDAAEEEQARKSKFCTNCGLEIDADATFCPQCGYKFEQSKVNPQTKFCQSCGEKININAEICPHCGVRVANVVYGGEKNVLLSAILSFIFPGLGHIYIGLNRKGVSFIIAYIISAILIMIAIGLVLVLIVWIWALIDSIKCTEALNKGEHVEDKLF